MNNNMKDKRIYGMFGPKIKAMRMEQGLKQRHLAELLGTDMPMYSKMELGARRVRRDQVPKLAELYKVDFPLSHKIAKSVRKWSRTQTDCFRIVFPNRKISNLEEIQVADFYCGPARA